MTDKIRALAASIAGRKSTGAEPFVLLVGAGASISSGCSPTARLADDVLESYERTRFEEWQASVAAAAALSPEFGELKAKEVARLKLEAFYERWARLDHNTKFSILNRHLLQSTTPSEGYKDLARLITAGYFGLALSTNLDNLLERALGDAGWREPEHFVVSVNGRDKPEEVRYQLESPRTPFKLVKLHGTLASPGSYAFTPDEIFSFEEKIKPELARYLNRGLLVVGHSFQDRDIDVLFEKEGGEIHFVNPAPPEPGSRVDSVLKTRGFGSIISGDEARFDDFFRELRSHLEAGRAGGTVVADSAQSIEGFLKSIGYGHELKAPRSRFKNLPELYVKPTEYDDIRRKLERDHVVFIIGEPHLGKTYTAFHLLWEYYRAGYEPLHIQHDRLVNLLLRYNDDFQRLLAELFVGETDVPRIIHFDDPFGGTLERRTERTDVFARELDKFLELAREYERVRVVVTTRLNVFREAVGETRSDARLNELERSIRVHTSYQPETLLDILHRYTNFYRPRWASDADILAALDAQLPALLPAPHNIEFFVRTSESLTTLEDVLRHVEESKEMVKALADWMGYLPAPEQVFLLLVEIAASAATLFPGTPAASMDVEAAYMETLAYLFKRKHLPGIPTGSFENARAKFDQILVERRDEDSETARLDFVHPSYHEAFWHAVRHYPALARWWELMQSDVADIFKDFAHKPDLVQLRMIERYGTVDRDLDRLLLISADSDDIQEQIIAFKLMLERPDEFVSRPQFSRCLSSITSADSAGVKLIFLKLVEDRFDQLPLAVIDLVPSLLFDRSEIVRAVAEELTQKHLRGEHSPVKNNERLKAWEILWKFYNTYRQFNPNHISVISLIEGDVDANTSMRAFVNLSFEEFKFLIQADYHPAIIMMVNGFARAHSYYNLPINKQEFLLSCRGFIQYEALTSMLGQYRYLPNTIKALIEPLMLNPQEPWVGAAMGRMGTHRGLFRDLSSLVFRAAQDGPKEVAGALLAELAEKARRGEIYSKYKDLLYQLTLDAETVQHASAWIEYKRETFPDFSEQDAKAIKSYLLNLPAA
ncbi:MAG TPA: SIR2 family protein [Pyrinomonadaceae bacterium]